MQPPKPQGDVDGISSAEAAISITGVAGRGGESVQQFRWTRHRAPCARPGLNRRPPTGIVSSGLPAGTAPRADHLDSWQLHDARQERPVRCPRNDGRSVLTVGQTPHVDFAHAADVVKMGCDVPLLPVGLDELQNDGSSGCGRHAAESYKQPRRLRPDKTFLRHGIRDRHQPESALQHKVGYE